MTKELWSDEYLRKGIPSSYRQEPTRVVGEFLQFLQKRDHFSGKILDLGAGKGRNGLFFAENGFEVIALDWVAQNVAHMNIKAEESGYQLKAFCQSVVEDWPILNGSIDAAIDIFCYKHVTDKGQQFRYRKNLFTALKPGGYYLISLAADDDGFYGPLLAESPDIGNKLIIDPCSKIGSFLYNFQDIIAEFSEGFDVLFKENYRSTSPMYGKEYSRSVLNLIFQKIPKT